MLHVGHVGFNGLADGGRLDETARAPHGWTRSHINIAACESVCALAVERHVLAGDVASAAVEMWSVHSGADSMCRLLA